MKKTLITVGLIVTLIIIVSASKTDNTESFTLVPAYYFDENMNPIIQSYAIVNGVENVKYISFKTVLQNKDTVPLNVKIIGASPTELANSFDGQIISVNPNSYIEFVSIPVDITPFVGKNQEFKVVIEAVGQSRDAVQKTASTFLTINANLKANFDVIIQPSINSSTSVDTFGIKQIYPSNGKEWFSKWNTARTFSDLDPQDYWFDTDHGDATFKVENGMLKITGNTPRMYIHDPTLQQSWNNVEMTVYAMRIDDTNIAYGGIEGVARTNHGTTNKPETSYLCDTRGIDARFRYDGKVDFEKETSHPSSKVVNSKTYFSNGLPKNQWIGYKFVVYDLPNGNVKLESYMDLTDGLNGGTWMKVNEFEDTGSNFGVGGTSCASGIDPALKLTNSNTRLGSESGKPNVAVYWRSDGVNTDGLIYKKMSVREI